MAEAAAKLREASALLDPVTATPRLDAELLLAHALGISRESLLLDLPKLGVPQMFGALVARRLAQEPIAHIVGAKEFWGLSFQVSPDVLIPRPDSELLIAEALRLFAGSPPQSLLDLGTGSGALLLSALHEFPAARGTGIDASAAALQVAHNNADRLALADRAHFHLLDWNNRNWEAALPGPFDLILANPPYIADDAPLARDVADYEPKAALFAGADGLDDYKILIPVLDPLLARGGAALIEIGFDQANHVSKLAADHGYAVECKQDFGGNDRLIILRRSD